MSDNGQQHHEDAEALRVKAQHREVMTRQEAELDVQRLHGLPFAARMYFDPVLFDRMNLMAERMAGSRGMPKHIQGDTIMALYCIERGWSWGMSPLAVAMGTFKIGDAIGHYGRTIIAAINNSGRLNEALKFEHFADGSGSWDKVTANFQERQSTKKQDEHGNPTKYLVPAYTRADEAGLGIKVSGHIKGEAEPRELKFYLKQAWPRNSTLWATDPARQIAYTAARAFANLYMPEIVAGARMEDDFEPPMRDITPNEASPERPKQPLAPPSYVTVYSAHGEEFSLLPGEVEEWVQDQMTGATDAELAALIDNNENERVLRMVGAEFRKADPARKRGRPKKFETIARDIIAELNAADPADVQMIMDQHAQELADLPDELRTEVVGVALDRGADQGDEPPSFADDASPPFDDDGSEEVPPASDDDIYAAWCVGMRHAISTERPEFLAGTTNRYRQAAKTLGEAYAEDAAREVETAFAARQRAGQ